MSEARIPLVPEKTTPLPKLSESEGLLSWVASVDHKQIGIMYILTAIIFFVIGGLEAAVMRLQLGTPRSTLLSPDVYNQLFTMHGTTMVFLVVVPLMLGFGVYFVPLQIGARDMAFPRMNLLGFWLLAFGGVLLYFSFVAGGAPNMGWFAYAPLSEHAYNSSTGVDYWALGLLSVGVGTVIGGINFIVTVLTLRAPGMKLSQVPMFVWTSFINSFLIVLSLPALNAALAMLVIDRQFNAHFFTPDSGGSAILWQQYFWAFGHPEVYIMILPAWGMIAEVIPVFSRKPLFGYQFFAGSSVAIAVLSFAVFAHHMFAVGLGHAFEAFFGATTEVIAIPTGVKIFNWIATMWGGKIRFNTPMLFAIAFIIEFVIGGVSGVSFAIFPIDWQVEDSYYVVAHMHYVLFGGTLLAVFAGTYYWFPKMFGRMLNEKLGKWHFWTIIIGFNLTFMVQHFLGLMGMPRRIYTYPDVPWWGFLNAVSTSGVFVIGVSVLIFLYNVWYSLRKGEKASDNPWNAWTLEWATTSPPPIENFHSLPPIHGRRPLWDYYHPEDPDYARGHDGKSRIKVEAGAQSASESEGEGRTAGH
jgi:cytochrome c oxidase subunit 1/cytochrome c oxidase subunit I+III